MTCLYWMAGTLTVWATAAAAQSAAEVKRIETPNAGVTVVIQGNAVGDLQTRLEDARARLAKAEEESRTPERALAVLLLLGKSELTSLVRVTSRKANRGIHRAEVSVYVPTGEKGDLVGVVAELTNPRSDEPWKADDQLDALVKTPPPTPEEIAANKRIRSLPPIRATVLRLPHPDAPGYKQRLAMVFDVKEAGLDVGPVTVELWRAGKWAFEFDLRPADLSSPTRSFPRALCQTDRCRLRRPGVRPALDAR